MAIGVFTLLTTVALPPLVRLFTSLGGELPWTTRSILVAGGFLIANKFYILGVLALLIGLIVFYVRLPSGKLAMDRLVLKIPMIGDISIQLIINWCSETRRYTFSNDFYDCTNTRATLTYGIQTHLPSPNC